MKKVIISGATGQDGSYMCEYLLNNTNYEVLAGVRRTSQAILKNLNKCINNPRFKIVPLELTDPHSITSLIKHEVPDYFINLGASSFVADSWNQPVFTLEVNSIALIHILESIRNYSPMCRLYSAGSSEQWGDIKYSPQDENHPFSPRSVYGVSKCCSSLLCKVYRESYNIIAIHGILSNHESPRRQSHFISKKITEGVSRISNSILKNLTYDPIYCGNIYAKRDWSHAIDFVDGIWRMLNQDIYRIDKFDTSKASEWKNYVLSSNETYSVKNLIELAFKKVGIIGKWDGIGLSEKYIEIKTGNILTAIDQKFYRPADVNLLHGNSENARRELCWKPTYTFDTLIEEMVKYDCNESVN